MTISRFIASTLLLLLSATGGTATAQRRNTDANIYGHVIDRKTGEPPGIMDIFSW